MIRPQEGRQTHILIIALTAHPTNGDRDYYQTVGMDDHLRKPTHTKDLNEAIERLRHLPRRRVEPD
jgi:CheY-like chemotaxis protein